jgi:predicted nucleic acid-binding protein
VIVIDFTVLARLFINGLRSPAARRALASDEHRLSAPIWRQQLLDALTEHMLEKAMPVEVVLEKMAAADFEMRTSHKIINDEDILKLSQQARLSGSQWTYVLVALKLGAKLITADSQIAAGFPAEASAIEKFVAD